MRTPGLPVSIVLVLLLPLSLAAAARGQLGAPEVLDGAPIYTVLPVDAIPAIDHPQYVPAEEAAAFLKPDEPVMGVTGGGEAKAFSLTTSSAARPSPSPGDPCATRASCMSGRSTRGRPSPSA